MCTKTLERNNRGTWHTHNMDPSSPRPSKSRPQLNIERYAREGSSHKPPRSPSGKTHSTKNGTPCLLQRVKDLQQDSALLRTHIMHDHPPGGAAASGPTPAISATLDTSDLETNCTPKMPDPRATNKTIQYSSSKRQTGVAHELEGETIQSLACLMF